MEIRQEDITKATMKILTMLMKEEDSVIKEVCKLSVDQHNLELKEDEDKDSDDDFFADLAEKEKEEEDEEDEAKGKESYVDLTRLTKLDSYKYLGGCLIACEKPMEFA